MSINVGDRVRVEFEGVVIGQHIHGDLHVLPDGCKTSEQTHVDWCTVLAPPAKVGDVLDDVDAVAALPTGAIVKPLARHMAALAQCTPGAWYYANATSHSVDANAIALPVRLLDIGGTS